MRDDTMNHDPGLRMTAERLLSTACNAHRDLRFGERKVFWLGLDHILNR